MFKSLGMTGEQLQEAMAYDVIEPLGSYKQDFMSAQLCNLVYTLAHAYGGKQVNSKIQDFMPWWFMQHLRNESVVIGRQPVEDMKRNLMEFARQHNRALERKSQKEGR